MANIKDDPIIKRQYDEALRRQTELELEVKSLKLALRESYIRHDILADKLEKADPRNAMAAITKGAKKEHIGDMSVYVIRHIIWYITKVLDTEHERVKSFGSDWREKLQLLVQREKQLSK